MQSMNSTIPYNLIGSIIYFSNQIIIAINHTFYFQNPYVVKIIIKALHPIK